MKCLFVLLGFFLSVRGNLPPIYGMDDWGECKECRGVYCEAKITVKSRDEASEIWGMILKSRLEKYTLDRGVLYRALCLTSGRIEDKTMLTNEVKSRFGLELANYSLEVQDVLFYICSVSEEKGLDTLQRTFLIIIVVYLGFLIFATLFGGDNPILRMFSLTKNHALLAKPINNANYQRLKSIQGIRTYNTMLIILGHTVMASFLTYSKNPEFFEEHAKGPVSWFLSGGMFLVQTNYLITGWLVIDSILQHIEKDGKIVLKDVLGVIILRILRLWPSLLITIFVEYSGIEQHLFHGSQKYFANLNYENCRQRWWSTAFFFSNFYHVRDVCLLHTWYLSADLQICICMIFVLMAIFNFGLPLIRSLLTLLVVVLGLLMGQIYAGNYDVIFRPEPVQAQVYNMFGQPLDHMYIWYSSALSNMPSFIVGLIFGTIYFRRKNAKYFDSTLGQILFWSLSFGASLGAVTIATFDYDRTYSAIFGALVKPMYTFGIAIGILAFSEGTGWLAKRVCEWRFAEFLSLTTYHVYLTHVLFAFQPILTATTLIELTWPKLIYDAIIKTTQSFAFGYVTTLMLELPWKNITKWMMGDLRPQKTKQN